MRSPRPFKRHRRRLPVRFASQGTGWRAAFTGDVSAGGLFVIAAGASRPVGGVELEVHLPGRGPVRLAAEVVWQRRVPPHLQRLSPGGFGLRLKSAPEDWFQYCLGLEAAAAG